MEGSTTVRGLIGGEHGHYSLLGLFLVQGFVHVLLFLLDNIRGGKIVDIKWITVHPTVCLFSLVYIFIIQAIQLETIIFILLV